MSRAFCDENFNMKCLKIFCLIFLYFINNSKATSDRIGCEPRGSSLFCRLRTIDGARALLDALPSTVVARLPSLRLQCNDVLFFESNLESYSSAANKSSAFLGPLKRLTDLQIDYCKIRRIPSRVFIHLTDMKNLILRTHNNDWSKMIMELDSESFTGLTELRHLDLSDNNIWNVPQEVFCPLYNLKSINLTRNRIQNVTQLGWSDWGKTNTHMRSCNMALEVLDLSENDIITLPDDGFSSLRSLTTLHLQENAVSLLGDRAFIGLSALQVLNASSNYIDSLPPDLFQSCRDIKNIYLNNNYLRVLAPGLFEGLDQLQILYLSHNELSSRWVNRDTFSGLVRMVILNLDHNLITKINSEIFRGLYSLQILHLEHNKIEMIAEDAFMDLRNLHALILSHNNLHEIEAYHFSQLFVLNQLSIDHNSINSIHQRAFKNLTLLEDLDVSGNNLHNIPTAIKMLRILKTLDMGKNNISEINNNSFEGLDQLYGLRLVDNSISGIYLHSFMNLPSLQVLNLASNEIKHIERSAFNFNPTLRVIRLDRNKLSDIGGIFNSLKSLLWLNVSDNAIVRFHYDDLPSTLEWLDMRSNKINILPQCASVNKVNIRMLDVSHNFLTEINSNVIPPSIESLFLNNNNISLVEPGTFIGKDNIEKVVLYGNAIRMIEMGALALTPVPVGKEVPQFYISGNPYECSCSMEWLQRINLLGHARLYPRVMDQQALSCSLVHSRGLTTKRVLDLAESQFLCPYKLHCFSTCQCCDYDACDCKMTCPTNCSCYHDMTWNRQVVDCSNLGFTEVPTNIPMDATEIYLDGNDLKDLASHVFIGKTKLQVLYLNNSNLRSVHNRTFKGVKDLKVLHLENNKLQELRGDEFDQLHYLNELYLDHNGIRHVGNDTFKAMKNLEVLRLDDNKIVNFSPWQLLASSTRSLAHVSLEGNTWTCDCQNIVKLESWLRSNPGDPEKMFCSGSNSHHEKETIASVLNRCSNYMNNTLATSIEQRDIYTDPTFIGQNYISIFAGIFISVLLVCMLGALIFAFRQDVRLWAHSKYGVRLFKDSTTTNIAELDTDRLYDAYLIYSIKDEDFVTRVISSELEQSGYSVCLHYKDIHMMTGNSYLSDSIASATEASRRIVVVLTINFLTLEWMNHDLRTSLLSTLKSLRLASKNSKMIFILTTDVSALNLDTDLQIYLRSHGVFYWGEKRFWEKFRFAMPDVSNAKSKKAVSTQSLKSLPVEGKSPNLRYTASPSAVDNNCLRYHQTLPSSGFVHHGGNGCEDLESSCSYKCSRSMRGSTGRPGTGAARGRTYFV